MIDGRVAAWMNAFKCMESANEVIVDRKKQLHTDPQVWQWHWSLIAQAHNWALLAQTPAEPALVAGEQIENERKRQQKFKDNLEERLARETS